MSTNREINQAAFRRLKPTIDRSYPHGRFVAIDSGAIVADAVQFDELTRQLSAMGRNARDVLIVQAGHDYPDYADILI
jgi:hypothetical protein